MESHIYKEKIRTWKKDGFRLELYDIDQPSPRRSQHFLAYEFFDGKKLIFAGDDYGCSPLHCIDSDECVAGLLSFLSLKPGDTDREYFDSYTPAQMEWCERRAEELSMIVYDMENSEEND